MKQAIIALTILCTTVGLGQNTPSTDNTKTSRQVDAAHGLVLKLSQDEAPTTTVEQDKFKECSAGHPPLACKTLILELRNEGTKTILRWFNSCHGEGVTFDIRKEDGSWDSFPRGERYPCTRNMLSVRSIAPGESFALRVTLADTALMLDTAYPVPNHDQWVPMFDNKGYRLLTDSAPLTIRARWSIDGCIAAKEIGLRLDPFAEKSLCLGGMAKQEFVVLQSNPLELKAPAQR